MHVVVIVKHNLVSSSSHSLSATLRNVKTTFKTTFTDSATAGSSAGNTLLAMNLYLLGLLLTSTVRRLSFSFLNLTILYLTTLSISYMVAKQRSQAESARPLGQDTSGGLLAR